MIVTPMLQARQTGRLSRQITAYQFGGYLLPRVQFTSEMNWKHRSTLDDHAFMIDGAVDSAKGIGRAPLDSGTFRCSGKFAPRYVRNKLVAGLAQSELAGIYANSGTWRQLVVHVWDNTDATDCEECTHRIMNKEEGVWMWTWAKIEEPASKSQMDDIIKGAESVEFNFILREPFRELDRFAWRFGSPPPIRQARTEKEMEQLVFASNLRHPMTLPDCSDTSRWYWRDPLACINPTCICFYNADCLWGTTNYRLFNASLGLNVPGTFEATGYIKGESAGTLVRVINDTYFVQEVTLNAGETVDLDLQTVYIGCTPKSTVIARYPRITPGLNRFEVVGRALIGIRPRWLL